MSGFEVNHRLNDRCAAEAAGFGGAAGPPSEPIALPDGPGLEKAPAGAAKFRYLAGGAVALLFTKTRSRRRPTWPTSTSQAPTWCRAVQSFRLTGTAMSSTSASLPHRTTVAPE